MLWLVLGVGFVVGLFALDKTVLTKPAPAPSPPQPAPPVFPVTPPVVPSVVPPVVPLVPPVAPVVPVAPIVPITPPAPPAPVLPVMPSSPTAVPTTTDALGNINVTVAPGPIGTLTMQSAASAVAAALTGSPAIPPALVIAAPTGATGVTLVASDNLMVMPAGINPSSLGQPLPSQSLTAPLIPGTANITVTWQDATNAIQTTTFALIAT